MNYFKKTIAATIGSFALLGQTVASPIVTNGSFELTMGTGTTAHAELHDPVAWVQENTTTGAGIQNAVAIPFTAEGVPATTPPRTGNNYLRLVHDGAPHPGGVWQNAGAMISGEVYRVTVDMFAANNVGPQYGVLLDLYAGSMDPGNLLDSDAITLMTNGDAGVIQSALLSATVNAVDGVDLIVRISAIIEGTHSRGGIDNVVLTVIPEPASLAVIGIGGLLVLRYKRN